jgi:hypothetical protein
MAPLPLTAPVGTDSLGKGQDMGLGEGAVLVSLDARWSRS